MCTENIVCPVARQIKLEVTSDVQKNRSALLTWPAEQRNQILCMQTTQQSMTTERHNTLVGTTAAELQKNQHMTERHTAAVGTATAGPQTTQHMIQHEHKNSLAAQTVKLVGTKGHSRNQHMTISNEQAGYKKPLIQTSCILITDAKTSDKFKPKDQSSDQQRQTHVPKNEPKN